MVYWADYNLRRIRRRAMDGSGDVETVLTLAPGTGPKDIAVVDLPEPDPRLGALAGLALLALFCERRRPAHRISRPGAFSPYLSQTTGSQPDALGIYSLDLDFR